jgi:hypothetical protein
MVGWLVGWLVGNATNQRQRSQVIWNNINSPIALVGNGSCFYPKKALLYITTNVEIRQIHLLSIFPVFPFIQSMEKQ